MQSTTCGPLCLACFTYVSKVCVYNGLFQNPSRFDAEQYFIVWVFNCTGPLHFAYPFPN